MFGGTAAIESQNVVGYKNNAVASDKYNFMVSMFDRADGKTMTLADIKVNDDFSLSTLSFLNAANAATRKFDIDGIGNVYGEFSYYFESDLEGTDFEGKAGWYYFDIDTGILYPVNSIEVPFGSMFYVQGAEDAAIVSSGVVLSKDQPIDVVTDLYNFMGNCSPVDLTLADIGVSEDFSLSTLSFLNPDTAATRKFDIEGLGNVYGEFSYYFESDLQDTEFKGKPGWYYFDIDTGLMYPANSVEVPAGSMFYVQGAEDAQIIIPAAL